MNTPLFDGGLTNYTNYFFEAYRIIINEQRMIESEEMKLHRQKSESKTGGLGRGNSGRRPSMGGASRARRR